MMNFVSGVVECNIIQLEVYALDLPLKNKFFQPEMPRPTAAATAEHLQELTTEWKTL